ncbi:MAG: ABC transporter permease [Pelolinea sp.]|nr:ABC transporter permease [Pelolinea sp.]
MNNSWRFLKEALESLNANKLRTGLTMLGIVIGVAAVISMMAIGKGAESSITSSIETMGSNLLFVKVNNDATNPDPLTLADAEAIVESGGAPSVLAVAPTVSTNKEISFGGNSLSVSITGLTPDYSSVRNEEVSVGRFISQEDIDNHATVAVIGVDIVTEFFASSTDALGNKLRIGNNLYQVVGVLESKGGTAFGSSDNQVYVPITTAQSRLVTRSSAYAEVDLISVGAVSSEVMSDAMNEITNLLHSRHGIIGDEENDFDVFSQETFTEAAESITGVMTVFLGGIAAISLLVGGIGIMNIMLVSVIERTKEIGLRKAVGARNRDIMLQFMVESLIIGLVGGLVGVLIGWGISSAISNIALIGGTVMNAKMSLDSVLMAVIFSVSVGLVFGIYPASRASKLEPVEALRTE